MTADANAGCLCGSVRLHIAGDPITVLQCHCTDCQKSTGGNAALIALVRGDGVAVTVGSPSGYAVTGASGGEVRRCFCPDCGTPLYSELGTYPGILAVKVGVWDEDPGLSPDCAIWTASAPDWHQIPAGIPRFPQARPPA